MLQNSNAIALPAKPFGEAMAGAMHVRPVNRETIQIDQQMANAVILQLRSCFVEQAHTLKNDLILALSEIEERPAPAIARIHRIAHNIAGNAATFGFPLLGQTAFSLCEILRSQKSCVESNTADIHDKALGLLSILQTVS